jgi:hypothetical protein
MPRDLIQQQPLTESTTSRRNVAKQMFEMKHTLFMKKMHKKCLANGNARAAGSVAHKIKVHIAN